MAGDRRGVLGPVPCAVLLLALGAVSCGDDGSPSGGETDALVAGPFLYDGAHNAPIGPFPITDLRSKFVESNGDSVDLYAEMENYETRNLEVFYPSAGSEAPVILFIHGGAWTDGYLEWYEFVAESFTRSAGYVTVVVNYRLASDSVFQASICPTRDSPPPEPSLKASMYPDNIEDCADALRWTIDHAVEYGGDPEKIFVFGHSAGGHLASLLATRDDFSSLRVHIRGLITMSGVYELDDATALVLADALGQTFGEDASPALLAEASPSTHVVAGKALPPFLVLYCEDDLPTFAAEAASFSSKLEALGFDVETVYLPGYSHVSEMEAIEFSESMPTASMLAFVAMHAD